MKTIKVLSLFIILTSLISGCKGKEVPNEKALIQTTPSILDSVGPHAKVKANAPFLAPIVAVPNPISQFVRRIFQDSKGNMWMGTNGKGVLFYDGKNLSEYSLKNGFDAVAVRAIVEDKDGHIWFATENGVIIYDPAIAVTPIPASFKKFAKEKELPHYDIWNLMIDSKDKVWINTFMGAASYQNDTVTPFLLPASIKDTNRGVSNPKMVSSVYEDQKGTIWFATPGGAFYYDGTSLEQMSTAQGLAGNSINQVLEDNNGNYWFATFYNGVSRYDGKNFTNFTKDGTITGDEVWSLFKDKDGNIWFPAEHHGVYKYDGNSFTNYGKAQGLESGAIQCVFQDKDGVIWFGGYLGLFRLDGDKVVSVTKVDLTEK